MLRHVLLFKFYDNVPEETRARAVAALKELGALVPEVREWSVERDIGVRPGRNHDLAQVSAFDDQAALERYRVHPEHIRVRDLMATCCDWVVVDYES